jgi:multiple sugar transport system permease protein
MRKQPWYIRLTIHLAIIVLAIPFAMPLLWMLSTSFKTDAQLFPRQVIDSFLGFLQAWWPNPIKTSNYRESLQYMPFPLYLRNTILLCTLNVFAAVTSSAMAAYAFAKLHWRGRNILFAMVIATIILPHEVRMIPLFALFRSLNWYGTFLPLIVPAFFGNAFFIFLLRQFFLTIPDDLCEAARIDGAGEWRIMWRIIMPLATPALATCALFQFLATWNDFAGPLLYLNDDRQYTLALGLQQFVGNYRSEWSMLMAAAAVFTIPIIILFFLAQRTFIQGIATTGQKG